MAEIAIKRGQETAEAAIGLALAVSRLRSRIRVEAGVRSTGIPISQLALLGRILGDGPATASSLAASEHVSQQAIAQSLTALRAAGLVQAKPDPKDGRKSLMSATPAGRRMLESLRSSREAWLMRAIDATVGADERAALDKAIELLERLADADLSPGVEIR
jgi:DNA-binding MarR family transcriptional regulator